MALSFRPEQRDSQRESCCKVEEPAFFRPRRTAGFSTPQDCPLRDQSCSGRNDNEGGMTYYAKLNRKHHVTPFSESVLLAGCDKLRSPRFTTFGPPEASNRAFHYRTVLRTPRSVA